MFEGIHTSFLFKELGSQSTKTPGETFSLRLSIFTRNYLLSKDMQYKSATQRQLSRGMKLGTQKKAPHAARLFNNVENVYAFLLIQFKSSNATSRRLLKFSSPFLNHTRGS